MNSEYREALDYLYSFTDYEKLGSFAYSSDRFDLERVRRLLALLDNPQRAFQSVHVAGTKGKGSTSAMLASILQQAGYRTALYTSPHLHTFRERIQIDGTLVPEEQVIAGVHRLRTAATQVPEITTFELITALAFDYYARQQAQLAVIEVGMGGRLDATNVIHPLACVITSISFDHMLYLGNSLGEIALEKAGIIKSGVPVISAPQAHQAHRVIESIAAEKKAPLIWVGRDWQWESVHVSTAGQQFSAWPTADPSLKQVYTIPLLGQHQQQNATVALATVAELRRLNIDIPATAVHAGLQSVQWPGRLEVLGQRPWVIVDGAHNADSMHKLRAAMAELFPHQRTFLILGMYADKDIDGILNAILPDADYIIVTQSSNPRALAADALAERVVAFGKETVTVPMDQALNTALALAHAEDLICATGSLSIAAGIRYTWFRHTGQPLPPSDTE